MTRVSYGRECWLTLDCVGKRHYLQGVVILVVLAGFDWLTAIISFVERLFEMFVSTSVTFTPIE
jgi:hypothetical protein